MLAAPEPEPSEEAGEPSWSSGGGQNGRDSGNDSPEPEEDEDGEEAPATPCSGWLFVGPRHRCFRGLLRQLAQDSARFAHV